MDTVIVLGAHCGVLVVEETIGSVTLGVQAGLGLLDIFPGPTVYIEWIVAQFRVRIRGVEQESVRTVFLLRYVTHTLVILVTLVWVWEETILLWTGRDGAILSQGDPHSQTEC